MRRDLISRLSYLLATLRFPSNEFKPILRITGKKLHFRQFDTTGFIYFPSLINKGLIQKILAAMNLSLRFILFTLKRETDLKLILQMIL